MEGRQMKPLQMRFYSNREMAEVMGLDLHDHNFSQKARRRLENWGYGFVFKPRRGFLITSIPQTPEERLADIMRRVLRINTQINPYEFACFFTMLAWDDTGFRAMPWETRVLMMREYFGVNISERTLQNWRNHLCDTGAAEQWKHGGLWHTYTQDGRKIQEPADRTSPEYKEYCSRRSALLKEFGYEAGRKEAWGEMVQDLYGELGCYYYCDDILVNAFGLDEIQEIMDLTIEVIQRGKAA